MLYPLKLTVHCLPCLMNSTYYEVLNATKDPKLQWKCISEVFDFLHSHIIENNFTCDEAMQMVPAYLGTQRDRIIQKISRCKDIFKVEKKESNEIAIEILSHLPFEDDLRHEDKGEVVQ